MKNGFMFQENTIYFLHMDKSAAFIVLIKGNSQDVQPIKNNGYHY